MDEDAKKTALRMIPYGIYVLTAEDPRGNVAAATVNWVTQTAFAPPLVVVGVKTDSGAYPIIKHTKKFTLSMLAKDAKGVAFTFFKPTQLEGGKLSGQSFHRGANAARFRLRLRSSTFRRGPETAAHRPRLAPTRWTDMPPSARQVKNWRAPPEMAYPGAAWPYGPPATAPRDRRPSSEPEWWNKAEIFHRATSSSES